MIINFWIQAHICFILLKKIRKKKEKKTHIFMTTSKPNLATI